MSSIIFRTSKGEACLAGRERYYMGGLINDLFIASLQISRYDASEDVILKLFDMQEYPLDSDKQAYESLLLRVSAGFNKKAYYNDGTVDLFTTALNTALEIGSDQIRLMARLHGQCELFAYVEEVDRRWVRDIINEGLNTGIYRDGQGWEAVAKLLGETSEYPGPVVTSFSVTDSFPDSYLAGMNDDTFSKLPYEQQFQMCVNVLRKTEKDMKRCIARETLSKIRFVNGVTGFDLRRYANTLKVKNG